MSQWVPENVEPVSQEELEILERRGRSESIEDSKTNFYRDMPDYTKCANGADLLNVLGDEGMKWAAAFCQITEKRFDTKLDIMYVQGWFANAIEHSTLVRKHRAEEVARSKATSFETDASPEEVMAAFEKAEKVSSPL